MKTSAMASSEAKVRRLNTSSRDCSSDRMDPVWTQIKLYGMRPVGEVGRQGGIGIGKCSWYGGTGKTYSIIVRQSY